MEPDDDIEDDDFELGGEVEQAAWEHARSTPYVPTGQMLLQQEIDQAVHAARYALLKATTTIQLLLDELVEEAMDESLGAGDWSMFNPGEVETILHLSDTLKIQYFTHLLLNQLAELAFPFRSNHTFSYDKKKTHIQLINSLLRRADLAFAHPETGDPCILYAQNSYDRLGRYTLENRITKKRSGSYKSLKELFPFKLVPDAPRKEGLIERRKNKPEE